MTVCKQRFEQLTQMKNMMFFTRSGLQRFARTGRISQFPEQIYTPLSVRERIQLLQGFREWLGQSSPGIYMFDDRQINVSDRTYVFTTVYLVHNEFTLMLGREGAEYVSICELGISDKLSKFCHMLENGEMVCTREECESADEKEAAKQTEAATKKVQAEAEATGNIATAGTEEATTAEAETTSSADADTIIYNLGSKEVEVSDARDADHVFEDDGSYTISITEANPYFPYEVQFKCGDETTEEWFKSPADRVSIHGHTFSVQLDGATTEKAYTTLSLQVGDEEVLVYPEEKTFTDSAVSRFGRMLMAAFRVVSKRDETKTALNTVDLSAYSPLELSRVQLRGLFSGKTIEEGQKVMWTSADDEALAYTVSNPDDSVDLSVNTYYGGTNDWRMLIGADDQLKDGTFERAAQNYHIGSKSSSNTSKFSGGSGGGSGKSAEVVPVYGPANTLQVLSDGTWKRSEYGTWSFIGTDGKPVTGFKYLNTKNGAKWFYFYQNGTMATGWIVTEDGKWYYMLPEGDQQGAMQTGFVLDPSDHHWYMLKETSGELLTGWQTSNGKYYYFNAVPGKQGTSGWGYNEESRKWFYTFMPTFAYGAMYQSATTPDGYQVDADGAWVK